MDNLDQERGKYSNLSDHKVSFDQDKMWQKINSKEKKRRAILWYWTGGSTLVLILAFALISTINNSSNNYTNAKIGGGENPQILETYVHKQSENEINGKTLTNQSETIENTSPNKQTKEPKTDKKNTLISRPNTSVKKSLHNNITNYVDPGAQFPITTLPFSNPTKEGTEGISKIEDHSENLSAIVDKTISKGERDERLHSSPLPLHTKLLVIENPEKIEIEKSLNPYAANSALFQFEIYGGYGHFSSSYTGSSEWMEGKQKTETAQFSASGGLRVSYFLSKNFISYGGIEYTMTSSRNKYDSYLIGNLASLSDGQIPPSITNTEGIVIHNLNRTYFNEHHAVSIPLGVGYQLRNKNFSFTAFAGFQCKLWNQYSGILLNSKAEEINSKDIHSNSFGYEAGIKLGVNLLGRDVYLSPAYLRQPMLNYPLGGEVREVYRIRVGVLF